MRWIWKTSEGRMNRMCCAGLLGKSWLLGHDSEE